MFTESENKPCDGEEGEDVLCSVVIPAETGPKRANVCRLKSYYVIL